MQTLSMIKFFVKDNTITQADGDTGDSAQRIGHFYALCAMAGINDKQIESIGLNYEASIQAHTAPSGEFVRSPDVNHWGNRPDNFSRDQWQALQLAFAVRKDKARLVSSFKALVKRGLVHQNTHEGTDGNRKKFPDIIHPSHISVLIRGLGWGFPLLPLLWVLDVFLMLDLIFRGNATDYDNMLAPHMLYANLISPTFVSRLAMKLYVRTNFIKCLDDYHSVRRNGILPFPALFWYAFKVNKFVKD